jgi:hypothetical protein
MRICERELYSVFSVCSCPQMLMAAINARNAGGRPEARGRRRAGYRTTSGRSSVWPCASRPKRLPARSSPGRKRFAPRRRRLSPTKYVYVLFGGRLCLISATRPFTDSFPEILQQQHGGAVRAPAGSEGDGHGLRGRAAHERAEGQIDIAVAVEITGVERHPSAVGGFR